ncbi:hypothetical protein HG530_013508 [Fusarium avenaceum]|nr:hypothetical protein HG530_013508 [Fusarium avenaceum]
MSGTSIHLHSQTLAETNGYAAPRPRCDLQIGRPTPFDSNKMLGSEVGTEVHDLPAPETNKEPGCSDTKPLDTVVGALVGVSELLFSGAEVLHLGHELAGDLFDTAELSFDGLELLSRLDGRPILGVGANVDVELDVAASNNVLEADIKGSVGVREVHHHAISLITIDGRCHYHECVLSDKVAYTALLFVALGLCDQVELESAGGADKQQKTADILQQ